MLNVFSWQQTALVWLTSIAICTILWFIGKKRDREARNPLHGILPYKTTSSNDKKVAIARTKIIATTEKIVATVQKS
ncbi:MAG: hypothetical protein F6K35_28500 [Okeania sp. SIO2H7]|nr:hypothetical protein [Okeania sp. SIO2H7]